MAYQGQQWNPAYQDQAPDLILKGYQGLASGISQAGAAAGKKIEDIASKRDQAKGVMNQWEMITDERPELKAYDEKFYGSNLTGQQSLLSGAISRIDRETQSQREANAVDFKNRSLAMQSAQAANTAAYQQGSLDIREKEVDAQGKPVKWSPLPNSKYIVSDRGSAIPVDKPPLPATVTYVQDEATGAGTYRDETGAVINPDNLLVNPTPAQPDNGFVGPPQPGLLPPAEVARPVPLVSTRGSAQTAGPRIINTKEGDRDVTFRLWPDGRTERYVGANPDNNFGNEWVPTDRALTPQEMGYAPSAAPAAPAARVQSAVEKWKASLK